jgi:hypothetical protein
MAGLNEVRTMAERLVCICTVGGMTWIRLHPEPEPEPEPDPDPDPE